MADLTITAANVKAGASATQISGIAGETITAGMAVYLNTSTQKWMKAQCDGTLNESGNGTQYGIALTGSSLDQPIVIDTMDLSGITIGATTVAGTIYCISATAGGICPWADLAATNKVTVLGVGTASNTIIYVASGATGVAHA